MENRPADGLHTLLEYGTFDIEQVISFLLDGYHNRKIPVPVRRSDDSAFNHLLYLYPDGLLIPRDLVKRSVVAGILARQL